MDCYTQGMEPLANGETIPNLFSHLILSSTLSQALVINLCLCDEAAREAGIENHVCEVQIILSAFSELLEVVC